MTGEKKMFTSYVKNKDSQDSIIFGDGNQGKVKGLGKIAISNEHSISNVFLVESLGYNLLSVSQLCNMGYNCLFTNIDVSVFRRSDGSLAFKGVLDGKLYLVDFAKEEAGLDACLIAKTSMGWLWHRRLAHVGMKNLHKLLKGEHVIGLTNVHFEKDRPCAACQAGKQVGGAHHIKNVMTTSRPLELLHMDLFGPVAYLSIGGSKYGLVIVDDFSRFTWVFFLQDKSETQGTLKRFLKRAQNEFELKVKKIRSDNGSEFKNLQVEEFLEEEGIKHEFFAPYTPQQNGVVERKNRTLIDMTQKFEMSMMGELNYFLGFQVKQLKDGTFISQTKYTQDLLKWFGMKDAKPAKTPMGTDGHTDLNKGGKSIDQKAYRSMIGSLLYLCASRPDIMLSVCMCARFQSDPRECHLVAVKQILRYLVATPCFGIWYPKGSTFDLIGYSDSDYAGCKVDRKSTSGMCQFLGRSLVSWSSKKQTSIALSTAEAEYVAAGQCCTQLLWMRQTLRVFGYNLSKVPLLCDNESAIRMADNPVEHSRTKHIDIRHHFLRDHQQKGDIEVFYVSTENQLADIFTKPLDEKTFCRLLSELNVLDS